MPLCASNCPLYICFKRDSVFRGLRPVAVCPFVDICSLGFKRDSVFRGLRLRIDDHVCIGVLSFKRDSVFRGLRQAAVLIQSVSCHMCFKRDSVFRGLRPVQEVLSRPLAV